MAYAYNIEENSKTHVWGALESHRYNYFLTIYVLVQKSDTTQQPATKNTPTPTPPCLQTAELPRRIVFLVLRYTYHSFPRCAKWSEVPRLKSGEREKKIVRSAVIFLQEKSLLKMKSCCSLFVHHVCLLILYCLQQWNLLGLQTKMFFLDNNFLKNRMNCSNFRDFQSVCKKI